MAKEFILNEELCQSLDLLALCSAEVVQEFCQISLQILDNDKYLSPKQLGKAIKLLSNQIVGHDIFQTLVRSF
jgi:hypothetical protein